MDISAWILKTSRIFIAKRKHDWRKMVSLYATLPQECSDEFYSSLRKMGIDFDGQMPFASRDLQYECAWKLGQWQAMDFPKRLVLLRQKEERFTERLGPDN